MIFKLVHSILNLAEIYKEIIYGEKTPLPKKTLSDKDVVEKMHIYVRLAWSHIIKTPSEV